MMTFPSEHDLCSAMTAKASSRGQGPGFLVHDVRHHAVAYMICEPSGHYDQIRIEAGWMTISIDQRI
jgi:hypothetical protein